MEGYNLRCSNNNRSGSGGKKIERFHVDRRRVQHVSQSEASYQCAQHTRILILGARFGGLATVLQLDRRLKPMDDASILVIDRNNDLLFTPLLWTIAPRCWA